MRCRIATNTAQAALVALVALASSAALSATFALADPAKSEALPGAQAADTETISPELREALQDLLNYDPVRTGNRRVSPLRKAPQSSSADWNRTDKNDGSAAVTVKKTLPFDWDANVGADIGLAANPQQTYQIDKLQQQSAKDSGSGAAWANVTVLPGLATMDARLDPSRDQGRIGTTLSRSMTIGPNYSITLQNSYAVTDTLANAQSGTMSPGANAALPPSQVWTNDRLVKFNILSTGTSLAAGTTNSSIDNITRNKFSAEQKLFQNFNVTTSVTDMGGPTASKSITAGFKLKW